MSWRKVFQLFCSDRKCFASFTATTRAKTLSHALREAKAVGWTVDSDKHWCSVKCRDRNVTPVT